MSFLVELWQFLRARKKFWLLPIIVVMLLLGGLLILAQGSVFHPAQYRKAFLSGASVAWSRAPWVLGCCARWTGRQGRRGLLAQ